jgi:hypothetical protein
MVPTGGMRKISRSQRLDCRMLSCFALTKWTSTSRLQYAECHSCPALSVDLIESSFFAVYCCGFPELKRLDMGLFRRHWTPPSSSLYLYHEYRLYRSCIAQKDRSSSFDRSQLARPRSHTQADKPPFPVLAKLYKIAYRAWFLEHTSTDHIEQYIFKSPQFTSDAKQPTEPESRVLPCAFLATSLNGTVVVRNRHAATTSTTVL